MVKLGPKVKPPRSTLKKDVDPTLHFCTVELRRASKKAISNESRKARRRVKEAADARGEDGDKRRRRAADYGEAVGGLGAGVVVEECLRRLGVANTGVGRSPLEAFLGGREGERERLDVKKAFERVVAQAEFSACMDRLNKRVSDQRRRELDKTEGVRGRKRKAEEKGNWSKGYEGQRGVFCNLNGEEEEEDVGEYAQYGPAGEDDWAEVTKTKKNRKGQRARRAKAQAKEARKRGERWDSSVNWREKKEVVETDDSGLKIGADGVAVVSKTDVGTMGKDWKEQGKAHPSWAAKKDQGIKEFTGTKITFDD